MNIPAPPVMLIKMKLAKPSPTAFGHMPLSKYQIGPMKNASRLNDGTHFPPAVSNRANTDE